ncbi:MAG: DUF4331 family protein [Acidobacteriaceae bacterium]|nr:DUF4331 family protein [Acidobacteriaceae bacterium]
MLRSMDLHRAVNRVSLVVLVASLMFGTSASLRAADHRDAPTVDGLPEGDITDVFAFLDPNDASKLVLVMNVNPFAVPGSSSTYRYSPDFLYQFKVDNTGDAIEDLVIQVQFTGTGVPQTVQVFGPAAPPITGARAVRLTGTPTVSGSTGQILTDSSGQIQVFTGLRDDPFVFDFSQFTRILNGSQDVFRAVTSPALGALRGRPVRADGTSGVDTFGGFNLSTIAVELPKAMVRGFSSRINVWATVSRPQVEVQGGANSQIFVQFERMGQQAFNTVFGTSALKDTINFTVPSDDVANYSSLVPDALTTTDNDGTGNTIANRAVVLNTVGVTALPNGAPLLLPSTFVNTSRDLLRIALLPDVLRLDLDLEPANLALGQFGLQNGRRLGDDAVDIALRLLRQLADVKFPTGSGLPGSGPTASRAALDCSVLPSCPDRRVLIVLQGTDFIKPDSDVADLTTSGNDRAFSTAFPFLANPHPLPGDPGTVGFPVQQ